MKNWIFLDERSENGVTYIIGKKIDDSSLYRWEPLTSRIHGYEAALFRQTAEKRCKNFLLEPTGIIPLEKPLNHLDQLWIGWQLRSGQSPFRPEYQPTELKNIIKDLYPLISAYEQFHYRVMMVGRPDWRRIFHDDEGFFMIDPWCRPYLQSPDFPLPAGLLDSRAPESFFGDEYSQSSDLFYLGLLIYFLISKKIPFDLEDGWPTKSLLKGDITPITHYCPEMNPSIARLLNRMLSIKKYERPSALQVKLFWKDLISRENYWASPEERIVHIRSYQQETTKLTFKKYSIRAGILLLIGLLMFISSRFLWELRSGPHLDRKIVESFYENSFTGSATPVSANRQDIFKDITISRSRRLKMINELISKPVVEIKNIEIKEHSPKKARVEVTLMWWEWSYGVWQGQTKEESLILAKKGRCWRVRKRFQKKTY